MQYLIIVTKFRFSISERGHDLQLEPYHSTRLDRYIDDICLIFDVPINTVPDISNIVARMQACLMVNTFDPTEVPNVLATSLAPTPNASKKDTTKPKMTTHKTSGEPTSTSAMGSILNQVLQPIQTEIKKHIDTLYIVFTIYLLAI